MKVFAPVGAMSFLQQWTLIVGLCPPEKQSENACVTLCKTDGNIEISKSVWHFYSKHADSVY